MVTAVALGLIAIIFGGYRSSIATATEISAFAAPSDVRKVSPNQAIPAVA